MVGVFVHFPHRHLVRAPIIFGALAIDLFGAGPALKRAQHYHRPARSLRGTIPPSFGFDALNLTDDGIEGIRHQVMHLLRLMPLDEVWRVAVAAEQLLKLIVADPGKNCGIGDLVAVEMKDRQHRAVRCRVEKLVRMPAGRERPRFGLAITDNAGNDQIGVVEGCSISVREGVAEFAALVDRTGVSGATWLGMPPGNENCLNSRFIPASSRVMFG